MVGAEAGSGVAEGVTGVASRQLIFDILANDKASAIVRGVGEEVDRQGKKWDAWRTAGVVASGAILAGLGKFATDSVQAFSESQTAQVGLQAAFERFPAIADTNIGALQALNAEIARKTGIDDDATAAAQANLAQFGLTGEQITSLTPLMADYAKKTGVDMATAADQLGKAMLGQGRALKGVGVDFEDTGTVAGNFDQVMAGLSSNVGGYAETMGGTAAGQLGILQDQFGELQESAGEQLMPALAGLLEVGLKVMDWTSQHKPLVMGLAVAVGGLAAVVLAASVATKIHAAATTLSTVAEKLWAGAKGFSTSTLGTWLGVKALEFAAWVRGTAASVASTAGMVAHGVAMGAVRVATLAWTAGQWLLNAALTANPIGIVIVAIAALVAGIVWAWNNVDWFREGVLKAWDWIKNAWSTGTAAVKKWVTDLGAGISRTWNSITSWTTSMVSGVMRWFSDMGARVGSAFTSIKTVAVRVFSWSPLGLVVTHWGAILGFVRSLPGKVTGALSGLWNGIGSGFRTAINSVIRAWNGFSLKIGGGTVLGVEIPSVTLATPNIPLLARGGVATRATLAVVGEGRSSEAILPFDRAAEFAAMVAGALGRAADTVVSLAGMEVVVVDADGALIGRMRTEAQHVTGRVMDDQTARVLARPRR